jgi:smad nuclear-interacting protein 1
VKDSSPPPRAKRASSGSPEPYRQSEDQSRHRKRDRSKDRNRDRSRERHRDRSRDRRRDRSRDRKRDRSRSRDRKKARSSSRDRKRRERSNRSASPLPYRSRKERSRSRSPKRRKRTPASPSPHERSRKPLPSQEISFRGLDDSEQAPTKYGGAPTDRQKPNFKTTGLLARDANKVEGTKISLKYHEPPEARKPPPSAPWRLFIFKGADTLGTLELHTQSCWLLGRAKEVADIPLEHPSSSSQHAAIQFRYIQKTVEDEYGVRTKKGKVKPYIIDLESSNGTELNDEELEAGRYYELRDKDILRFAGSEREYVIMLPPKE